MQSDRLVGMANQIGAFFSAQGDGPDAVADHLRRFWDVRMRAAIVAHWQAGGAGLAPLPLAGVALLAQSAVSAATNEPQGPH